MPNSIIIKGSQNPLRVGATIVLLLAMGWLLSACAGVADSAPSSTAVGSSQIDSQADTDEACVVPVKNRNTACTHQYEPVCGCDGKTYGNACVARANGVTKVAEGRCEDNHEQL